MPQLKKCFYCSYKGCTESKVKGLPFLLSLTCYIRPFHLVFIAKLRKRMFFLFASFRMLRFRIFIVFSQLSTEILLQNTSSAKVTTIKAQESRMNF